MDSGEPFRFKLKECDWKPSTDWSHGGPLIERFGLGVAKFFEPIDGPVEAGREWGCLTLDDSLQAEGATPLIAAMRAIVAVKLGDTVDIPDEIVSS